MATDQRPSFADVDDELFSSAEMPSTTRDVRSVGELLFNVDHLARQLLLDVDGEDAAPLLRSWPPLVEAAASVWAALPSRSFEADDHARTMASLTAHTETLRASLARSGAWPGFGVGHSSLDQMTHDLLRARRLVTRYGGHVRPEQPGPASDLRAARTRIMHGLYVAAHATNVALHEVGRDRVREMRRAGHRVPPAQHHSPYVVAPLGSWVDQVTACENDAQNYLGKNPVQTLRGEASGQADGPRLTEALAVWDIACHRALARSSRAANLVLITRTHALIASASGVLIEAAGAATPGEAERLLSTIAGAGHAWNQLASRWIDFTSPALRIDEPLARAATELRSAYRQIMSNATTLAPLEAISDLSELPAAFSATLRALQAGAEVARAVADKAESAGLRGPARALSRRAHDDVESGMTSAATAEDVVWISPEDIVAGRVVAVPYPVAERLRASSEATVDRATAASRAAAQQLGYGHLPLNGAASRVVELTSPPATSREIASHADECFRARPQWADGSPSMSDRCGR